MKENRRTRRTRQFLRDAFLSLLKEKRYEDISVQDIIKRADVARSTFYAHYVDKEDLLVGRQGVFASNLGGHAELMAHEEKRRESVLSTRDWFHHIRAQRDILKIIARDSAMDLAMKNLRDILRADIQVKVEKLLPEDGALPPVLVVDYLTDSLMSLLKWWVKQGMTYSPEQMDEIFQRLVTPGISSMSIIKT